MRFLLTRDSIRLMILSAQANSVKTFTLGDMMPSNHNPQKINFLIAGLASMWLAGCSGSPVQVSQSPSPISNSPSPKEPTETEQGDSSADIPKIRSIDELLLFQPSKYPEGVWTPQDLNYLDVYFESADGTRIHSWYCETESPVAHILFLHGNAGNLSGRSRFLKKLQEEHHVSVLCVDYRGYGRSEGKATAEGAIADAKAARKEFAKLANIKEQDVVLMGRSLGGAIAIQLAADLKPKGLIVESSFSSLKSVAKHHFPKLAWLVPEEKLNSEATIKNCTAPVLISHGDRDQVIPDKFGKALFAAANEPKRFVTIPGAGHNDRHSQEYDQIFDQFLRSLNSNE